MARIITTTQMQQKIGQIADSIETTPYIVTNRGMGKIILLPYYDGCDEIIEDYMEDYEIWKNGDKLEKKWKASLDSGDSDLVI